MTTTLDMLIAIRGGFPERCDFCDQPYGKDRHPVPEWAGAWACTECRERREKEDQKKDTP